ncbi:MAG: hypothetical protein Q9191_000786 [Dirinaria sp. TL-2023a]
MGILDLEGIGCKDFRVNRSLLIAVLAEVKTLLESFAEKNGKYENMKSPEGVLWSDDQKRELNLQSLGMIPERDGALGEKNNLAYPKAGTLSRVHGLATAVAQSGKRLRTIVMEPKRLVWVTVDKDSFEALIARLEGLNTYLISLLDNSQLHRLQETINTSYLEILQVRNDLVSLTTLVKALEPHPRNAQDFEPRIGGPYNYSLSRTAVEEAAAQRQRNDYLKQLTEIKIQLNLSSIPKSPDFVDSNLLSKSTPLPLDKFVLTKNTSQHETLQRRSSGTYQERRVWIEWTDLYVQSEQIERRISLLANLLCFVKPEGFRAPLCLGYVKASNKSVADRFGIAFENSLNDDAAPDIIVLQDILGQESVPSLSARASLCAVLARSVNSFHAVGWLHKALRADSIVFPVASSKPLDLSKPLVSGFELSRPSIIDEMTEKPKFNPWKDIYRHPRSQSSQSDGIYRKSYDLYSLGVVLLEIALWKRVEVLVGLNLSEAKPTSLLQVRSWLLGKSNLLPDAADLRPCLYQVGSACGDAFSQVVKLCFEAVDTEETEWLGEDETSIDLRLQRMVEQDVVKKLERIAEVL